MSTWVASLRKGRKVSLGVLAQQAGINKSTLSRWESGTSVPRVPEMMRVLDALGASTDAQAKALRLLDVPRAIVAERTANLAPMRLSLGDLLFGLRQRAGLTQAEAARGAGVTQGLYSRWEGDGAQPDAGQIHAVCFALGATGEEAVTLASRSFADAPVEQDREAILERYMDTQLWEDDTATAASCHLHSLSYLANLGRLYRAGRADIGDIALMVADFGYHVSAWEADSVKAKTYYRRARVLAGRSIEPLHRFLVPAISTSDGEASLAEASVMMTWLPRFTDNASRAYILASVAKALAATEPDAALCLADTYCALVQDNADEYPCRLRDRGNLLRLCGRSADSVAFLSGLQPQDSYREILKHTDIAKGLVALGEKSEAAATSCRAASTNGEAVTLLAPHDQAFYLRRSEADQQSDSRSWALGLYPRGNRSGDRAKRSVA